MTQPNDREPPMSPCLHICRLHEDGRHCVGCRRTMTEITGWWGMSDAEKRAVLADLKRRELPPSGG